MEARRKCKQCGERKPITRLVRRKGGGAYNRASRWIAMALCIDCARALTKDPIGAGHRVIARWSIAEMLRFVDDVSAR